MNKETVHLVATILWVLYSVVVGALAVIENYSGTDSNYLWLGIIVAIIGNSTHLVTMSLSQKGLTINAQGASSPGPPKG